MIKLCSLQAQPAGGVLPHLVFEYLSGGVHGKCVHEFDISGDLVTGQAGGDEVPHLLLGLAEGVAHQKRATFAVHIAEHDRTVVVAAVREGFFIVPAFEISNYQAVILSISAILC